MRALTDRYDRYEHLAYEYPQAALGMTKLAQLKGVQTLPQLARLLEVKPASLSYILYWTPPERKYETFAIPKKGGGRRTITAPKPRLKMIQKKLPICFWLSRLNSRKTVHAANACFPTGLKRTSRSSQT